MILTEQIKKTKKRYAASHKAQGKDKLTVLVPAYNEAEYVGDTILSLQEQTFPFHSVISTIIKNWYKTFFYDGCTRLQVDETMFLLFV